MFFRLAYGVWVVLYVSVWLRVSRALGDFYYRIPALSRILVARTPLWSDLYRLDWELRLGVATCPPSYDRGD